MAERGDPHRRRGARARTAFFRLQRPGFEPELVVVVAAPGVDRSVFEAGQRILAPAGNFGHARARRQFDRHGVGAVDGRSVPQLAFGVVSP